MLAKGSYHSLQILSCAIQRRVSVHFWQMAGVTHIWYYQKAKVQNIRNNHRCSNVYQYILPYVSHQTPSNCCACTAAWNGPNTIKMLSGPIQRSKRLLNVPTCIR